jgi:hypothetical protein
MSSNAAFTEDEPISIPNVYFTNYFLPENCIQYCKYYQHKEGTDCKRRI